MTIKAPGPGIVIFGDARNPWDEREIQGRRDRLLRPGLS